MSLGGSADFKAVKASQMETRKTGYQHTWKTDLMGAIAADPLYCCFGVFCPWCASYHGRKRAIYNDMSRYVCCNGDCPCSGRMKEQECPEFCLCLEVAFCFTQSVASTRWMLQDEMHIANTQCDNCLIGTMIAFQYLSCLCDIAACLSGSQEIAELANCIDIIAQFLWVSVCACMLTQHKVQLDERDKNPGAVRPPMNPYMAPAPQAIPPPGGFPAGYTPQGAPPNYQPQPGFPAQGYPPAGPQAYPPQNYPPQGYPQGYQQGPQQPYPPQGYPQQQQMGRPY